MVFELSAFHDMIVRTTSGRWRMPCSSPGGGPLPVNRALFETTAPQQRGFGGAELDERIHCLLKRKQGTAANSDPVRFAHCQSGQCSKPPIFSFFHLGEFGSYVLSSHFSQGSALVRWNLDWGRAESALFFGAHAFCRCIFFTLAATFGPTPQANFLGCSTETENCGHIDRRVLRHPTSTTKHQLRDASASER